MKHVGHQSQPLAGLERGQREQNEPPMFVGVGGVERRAIEEHGAVDEVHRRPAARLRRREHAERITRAADFDRHVAHTGQGLEPPRSAAHRRIEGHEGTHVGAASRKLTDQCTRDVRESAGLGVRHDFRREDAQLECGH